MHPNPYTVGLLQDLRNEEFHREAATYRLIRSATSDDRAAAGPSPARRVRTTIRPILATFARLSFSSRPNRPAAA